MCELILSQDERDAIDAENIMARVRDPNTTLAQSMTDCERMAEITLRRLDACKAAMRSAGLIA